MKSWLILLIAPVLNASGIAGPFQAGAISCSLVRRSVNTVQHYCYLQAFPSLQLIHNAIETINGPVIITYNWCAPLPPGIPPRTSPCSYAVMSAVISPNASGGIDYQMVTYSDGGPFPNPSVVNGTLDSVYQ